MGKTNKMLILKGGGASGYYFCPPVGFPEANTVFKHSDVQLRIHSVFKIFSRNKVWIYSLYTNSIQQSSPAWKLSVTTSPDQPSNLIIEVQGGELVIVNWKPAAGLEMRRALWKLPYNEGFIYLLQSLDRPSGCNYIKDECSGKWKSPSPVVFSFTGLVPGRAYNISVETVSEGHSFEPITNKYWTVPLQPNNVTFEPENISPYLLHSEVERTQWYFRFLHLSSSLWENSANYKAWTAASSKL